jgi:hypothetical protein
MEYIGFGVRVEDVEAAPVTRDASYASSKAPMEGFIYFFALIPSLGISLALRALIRWLTASWQSNNALPWQNIIGAALRDLPWALAFSPVMMMKGGARCADPRLSLSDNCWVRDGL